jgi:hypothetical protein
MRRTFYLDVLPDALDQIGSAAVAAGTKPHIAVYGGSALTLARNFRFATRRSRYRRNWTALAGLAFGLSLNASRRKMAGPPTGSTMR